MAGAKKKRDTKPAKKAAARSGSKGSPPKAAKRKKKKVATTPQRIKRAAPKKPKNARKKPARPKQAAGQWEISQRLLTCERLMSGGATRSEVIYYCQTTEADDPQIKKNWSVAPSTADKYMRTIRDIWKEEEKELRPERRTEMRVRLNLLYRTAMERNQLYAAARACDLLCKLGGLYEPERIALTIEDMDDVTAKKHIEHAYNTLQLAESEEAETVH